jgi:hypothetical protein
MGRGLEAALFPSHTVTPEIRRLPFEGKAPEDWRSPKAGARSEVGRLAETLSPLRFAGAVHVGGFCKSHPGTLDLGEALVFDLGQGFTCLLC